MLANVTCLDKSRFVAKQSENVQQEKFCSDGFYVYFDNSAGYLGNILF